MGNINDVSKHMTTLFSYNKKWLMLYDTYIHMYDQHNRKLLYIFPPSLSQDESKKFNTYFVS